MPYLKSVSMYSPIAARALADNPPTVVNVDANVNRHPISPNIYGVNWAKTQEIATLNAPLNRSGGNANSRYNWQLDAHSTDADWFFETCPDTSGTPAVSADNFVTATHEGPASHFSSCSSAAIQLFLHSFADVPQRIHNPQHGISFGSLTASG